MPAGQHRTAFIKIIPFPIDLLPAGLSLAILNPHSCTVLILNPICKCRSGIQAHDHSCTEDARPCLHEFLFHSASSFILLLPYIRYIYKFLYNFKIVCTRCHFLTQDALMVDIKFVEIRSSFSGSPNCSFPRAMLFIKNAIFLARVLMVCLPSPSPSASPGVLP